MQALKTRLMDWLYRGVFKPLLARSQDEEKLQRQINTANFGEDKLASAFSAYLKSLTQQRLDAAERSGACSRASSRVSAALDKAA